jgi:hypothetical protein
LFWEGKLEQSVSFAVMGVQLIPSLFFLHFMGIGKALKECWQ